MLYWIYLLAFTFLVFVPVYVKHGFYGLDVIQTQQLALLILGYIGFAIFLVQEKKLSRNLSEKIKSQRKANRMAKDLTHSYSYIGEINRKLDILEQIALSYPESLLLTAKKQKEIYDSIVDAIRLFGKSDEFSLRFVCTSKNEILKEVKSSPDLSINFPLKNFDSTAQFSETDEFLAINSPKAIDNIFSCILIRKKIPRHKIEDLETMKVLAAQALFLFMFVRGKKQITCGT